MILFRIAAVVRTATAVTSDIERETKTIKTITEAAKELEGILERAAKNLKRIGGDS
jgi:hypothetical protein